jgi:hypothetical protein
MFLLFACHDDESIVLIGWKMLMLYEDSIGSLWLLLPVEEDSIGSYLDHARHSNCVMVDSVFVFCCVFRSSVVMVID